MSLNTSLLALTFTGLELAIMICVILLCVALLIVSIAMLASAKKRNNTIQKATQEEQNKTPVVIYQTKQVEQIVQEEPAAEEAVEQTAEEVTEEVQEEAPVAEEAVEQTTEECVTEEVREAITEEVREEAPAVVEAPVAVAAAESGESSLRYNRSFRARIIQAEEEVKQWYGMLKNFVTAYDKVSSRISWKYESFSYRRHPVARVFLKGKTLYLYLPLNAADYEQSKYKLEDVSNISQFAETPALYRLKSERRVRYALELIEEIITNLGSYKRDREPVDYYEPYKSDEELMEEGLVKPVIEDANTSFIAVRTRAQEEDSDTDEN